MNYEQKERAAHAQALQLKQASTATSNAHSFTMLSIMNHKHCRPKRGCFCSCMASTAHLSADSDSHRAHLHLGTALCRELERVCTGFQGAWSSLFSTRLQVSSICAAQSHILIGNSPDKDACFTCLAMNELIPLSGLCTQELDENVEYVEREDEFDWATKVRIICVLSLSLPLSLPLTLSFSFSFLLLSNRPLLVLLPLAACLQKSRWQSNEHTNKHCGCVITHRVRPGITKTWSLRSRQPLQHRKGKQGAVVRLWRKWMW